jgi:hypothetical protein
MIKVRPDCVMFLVDLQVLCFWPGGTRRKEQGVGNVHIGSVTSVELRKNDNKHYYNDESPYKCGMKQEHETLATRIMYLLRVLPNARYSATK